MISQFTFLIATKYKSLFILSLFNINLRRICKKRCFIVIGSLVDLSHIPFDYWQEIICIQNDFVILSSNFNLIIQYLPCLQIIIQSVWVQPKLMRKKKEVPISTFFKEEMNINRKSINLQNKGITVIDQISPFLSSEIQVLNLKSNKLTSLKGIEQLSFLKELDVSANKITNCRQLQRVKNLIHLKKIYFSNNPFLAEPIDEDLLDIILQRETDIDLFSMELIKEVQNEQIKIIFLKNYLSKIKLHQQLRENQLLGPIGSKLKTEALVDKIVPQFYSIIENPNLANSIKRQTLDIKKKSNQTLQGALAMTKDIKQKKLDELINNIVEILHQSNNFVDSRNFTLEVNLNNSTISFSPQKNKGFRNSLKIDQEAEFSPVKYIDFSKDDNTLYDIGLPSSKPIVMKGRQGLSKIVQKMIFQERDFSQDNIETARKHKLQQYRENMNKSIQDQLRQVHQKKAKIQKKLKAKQQSQSQTEIQRKSAKKYLTKPDQTKKETINYIKVVEAPSSRGESQESPIIIHRHSPTAYSRLAVSKSPKYGKQSIMSWKSSVNLPEQLTLQNFEVIYYKTMTKIHPMFHLLHSPSESLKKEQKDTILQALKITHKQHYFQLFKQKISNLSLKKQNDQIKKYAQQKIQQAFQQNKDIYNENIRLKQQFEWVSSRNKALQQDYSKLYSKHKELQNIQKNKSTAITVMQTSYKKIKQSYLQKTQELNKYAAYDQKEDAINAKRQDNLRKKYFRQVLQRAKIWKKVLAKQKQTKRKDNGQLLDYGFYSFRMNYNLFKAIKQQINNRNQLTLKENFKSWLFCNKLQRKQKKLQSKRNNRQMNQFIELLRKNQGIRKMIKLKNIWALRFYKQQKLKKSMKEWMILNQQVQIKKEKAQSQYIFSYSYIYFNAIKRLIELRKKNSDMIKQKRENRKYQQQFRKLMYLMRKDLIVNRQKQNRVRLYFQKSCRIRNYNQLKQKSKQLKQSRKKVHRARIDLLRRMLKAFKQRIAIKNRQMGKLAKYIRFINRSILKKCLLRQKMSFDISNQLVNYQKGVFIQRLKFNLHKQKAIRQSWSKMVKQKQLKLKLQKLKFIKKLEITRLRGHDFVKHRVIEEMGVQMNLNDNQTIEIIKQDRNAIQKCQEQIVFLKKQIQLQSNRQLMIMTEKDELLLSVNQSYEIIVQLKKEIELLKNDSLFKQEQNNNLARKYNQIVKAINNRQKIPLDPTKLI